MSLFLTHIAYFITTKRDLSVSNARDVLCSGEVP